MFYKEFIIIIILIHIFLPIPHPRDIYQYLKTDSALS